MNVSCPQHPGKALKPEADGHTLLYSCGTHYALLVIFHPDADRKTTPEVQARVDELNRQVAL